MRGDLRPWSMAQRSANRLLARRACLLAIVAEDASIAVKTASYKFVTCQQACQMSDVSCTNCIRYNTALTAITPAPTPHARSHSPSYDHPPYPSSSSSGRCSRTLLVSLSQLPAPTPLSLGLDTHARKRSCGRILQEPATFTIIPTLRRCPTLCASSMQRATPVPPPAHACADIRRIASRKSSAVLAL